ncbi:MAG: ATP-dependent DNA helicase DinG [Treponema sp.]|jgi:ATP-dependent DNA helicase DinG|nr:ATP-dependent DNA helicase DinG [Treponema sp.]
MQAEKRFTRKAILALGAEIADSGGNEVFALGFCNDRGLVENLKILARGNESSVLAVREFFDDGPARDGSSREGGPDVFVHNHPSGFLTPSDNDLSVSARAAESGIGAYIVDNAVSSVYVVAEPVKRRKRKKLNEADLCAVLEEGGKLAQSLSVYEKRDSQLSLIRLVARAFNDDLIAAAEAGTGVGKSFAYLLPAIEFALGNDERIVVSTATINLQQQLFEKDIPLVAKSLGKKVKAVLVKGRGNYLCRRRLAEAQAEPPLDDAEYEELRSIMAWAETAKSGSRSDLGFVPGEGVWGRICSEADTCMGMRCPERERCFFLRLRRECADARILVVNHHLLFADLAARYQGAGYESSVVLPPYTRVIIDEAHNIERDATSFFSREWSRLGVNRALGRLYRKRRNREAGLLCRLAAVTPYQQRAGGPAGSVGLDPKIPEAAAGVREWAEKAGDAALSLCGDEGVFRLVPGGQRPLPEDAGEFTGAVLFPALAELRRAISVFAGLVRAMLEEAENSAGGSAGRKGAGASGGSPGAPGVSPDGVYMPGAPGQTPDGAHTAKNEESVIWEIKSVVRRLESAGSVCASFLEYRENPGDVYWIERQGGGKDPWAVFNATPVDVAPLLRDALFDTIKTVVCVSATLTVHSAASAKEPSFAYWEGRCGAGLSDRGLVTGVFPSPFPYAKRTLLGVPLDAPPPESPEYQDFINRAVSGLAGASGGSALVLFTSFKSLQSAWQAASPSLEALGIRCLRQGADDRSRLLSEFLADTSSALFATDSFWEGVDAPGDTLRLVILCRLPFRTPKDPVFEARRELLEKRGGNAFMELSLPDAVMKFKQGFGRLMRRSSDHGAVVVLDSRIVRKFYGKAFLDALPETKTSVKAYDSVLRDLEDFLFSPRA